MNWRKRLLLNSRLYAIVDKDILKTKDLSLTVINMRNSGVGIIQFRDKSSSQKTILNNCLLLKHLLNNKKTLFIVNDRVDIAKASGSDGVHIGQEDMAVKKARKIMGKDKLIGVSCHSLKQARQAQKEGADYIGIGPVFSTSTKANCRPVGLSLIKQLEKEISIPFFAIGGINTKNIKEVISAGANRAALCSAIITAKDTTGTISKFKSLLFSINGKQNL